MAPYTSRRDDRIIVVYGATGSGKSTLIERLTGHTGLAGHGCESKTTSIAPFRNEKHDKTCVFIDTPGFDATHGVQDVTPKIVEWLEKNYKGRAGVTGILYVHPIDNTRINFSANEALRRFRALLGDNALGKVVILSTMWDTNASTAAMDEQKKIHREERLRQGFWHEWLGKGSRYARFRPATHDEAWKIVHALLACESNVAGVHLARPSDEVQGSRDRKGLGESVSNWARVGGFFKFTSP